MFTYFNEYSRKLVERNQVLFSVSWEKNTTSYLKGKIHLKQRKYLQELRGQNMTESHPPTHLPASELCTVCCSYDNILIAVSAFSFVSSGAGSLSVLRGQRAHWGGRSALLLQQHFVMIRLWVVRNDWTPRLERPEVAEEGRSWFKEV